MDHEISGKSAATLHGQHNAVLILLLEHNPEETQPVVRLEVNRPALVFVLVQACATRGFVFINLSKQLMPVCLALITAGVEWS